MDVAVEVGLSEAGTPRPRPSGAVLVLSGRALTRIGRQPALWVPTLAFPLLFVAVSTSAFSVAETLAAFPPDSSFLAFSIPTTLLQSVFLTAVAGGTEHAQDIEDRFHHRLLLSPISRVTSAFARMVCAGVMSFGQAVVLVVVFWVAGARYESGPAGPCAIILLTTLLGTGLSGLTLALASATGSVQSIFAAYPLFFLLTFFSTALFPSRLMAPWFATIVDQNPLSWVLADLRALVDEGWSARPVLRTLGLSCLLCASSGALAALGSKRRGYT